MNKRIRKKKEKQQIARTIRELVAESQRQEERRQALIQKWAADFVRYYEQNRARQGL